jgi:pimeloyl-ACP methyl ester carboxylesterase
VDTFDRNSEISIIESGDKITFSAASKVKRIEVIFFQGGLADPKAYAPLCRRIAENGFTCHLIKMAWRLPQYDYEKITKMFDLNSGQYVIGGHSQGAKMAAQFVYENPNIMKGLFLLGTSTPKDIDLSNFSIPTIKLYAENDGLASVEEVMRFKDKLPKNTKLILIQGGNHSQFGFLGRLFLDDKPSISLEEQQQRTLEALISFLNEIN